MVKQRRTNDVINAGGKEKGWEGKWLMCVMRQDLKCSVALCESRWCWPSGGNSGESGQLSRLEAFELVSDGVVGRVE